MTTQTTIKGITYDIKAEEKFTGKALSNGWASILLLVRPKGHKEFWAVRRLDNNEIELT